MQLNFSVKLADLALTFFPRENLLIAKNQCHFPREKTQCHFHKITSIWRNFEEKLCTIAQFDECFEAIAVFYAKFSWFSINSFNYSMIYWLCLFSKQCRNTIARSFLRMHWNCQSLGTNFHPSGLRPLGWNESLGIGNFNASLEMIVQ